MKSSRTSFELDVDPPLMAGYTSSAMQKKYEKGLWVNHALYNVVAQCKAREEVTVFESRVSQNSLTFHSSHIYTCSHLKFFACVLRSMQNVLHRILDKSH